MNDYKVYAHITPNDKIYIGITKSAKPENRWGSHGQGYRNQQLFNRAIQKYGWDNIKHIILLENLSKEEADECEKYLIAKYNTNNSKYGYNLTEGGDGIIGYKFSEEHCKQQSIRMMGHTVSEETRRKIGDANSIALKGRTIPYEVKQKISKSLSGENHYLYGKSPKPESIEKMRQKQIGNTYHLGCKATDEQRKHMSEAHKGLPLTQKQLDNLHKIHQSNRGKPRSDETKQKMRLAKLGKKRGSWTNDERKAHMEAIERKRKEKLQNTNT